MGVSMLNALGGWRPGFLSLATHLVDGCQARSDDDDLWLAAPAVIKKTCPGSMFGDRFLIVFSTVLAMVSEPGPCQT